MLNSNIQKHNVYFTESNSQSKLCIFKGSILLKEKTNVDFIEEKIRCTFINPQREKFNLTQQKVVT